MQLNMYWSYKKHPNQNLESYKEFQLAIRKWPEFKHFIVSNLEITISHKQQGSCSRER